MFKPGVPGNPREVPINPAGIAREPSDTGQKMAVCSCEPAGFCFGGWKNVSPSKSPKTGNGPWTETLVGEGSG